MINENLPILVDRDNKGDILRILIREDWYDKLLPLYEKAKVLTSVAGISKVPAELERATELINSLIIDHNAIGWGFSFSLIAIFLWAANKATSVGKFVYEKVGTGFTLGGTNGATLGGPHGGTLGSYRIAVKELVD